jgi:hypothetical protein
MPRDTEVPDARVRDLYVRSILDRPPMPRSLGQSQQTHSDLSTDLRRAQHHRSHAAPTEETAENSIEASGRRAQPSSTASGTTPSPAFAGGSPR